MNNRMLMMGSLTALLLGGSMVGCTAGGGNRVASASDVDAAAAGRTASTDAARATKALSRRDAATAIGLAEGAVSLAPRNAAYRVLLGQSYLQAGRFASAGAAYKDALALEPGNGRAALNLALSQIATGDWVAARATLAANERLIGATDRGLALALAGDPATAVAILTQVVRSPDTSAKARQNLGLALALAGQWGGARVVASADMAPAQVDARMAEWTAFAQPHGASDQVASLLGVRPSADAGQPVALALNAPVPVQVAEAAPVAAAPVAAPAMLQPIPVAAAKPAVDWGARHEVVQPLPTSLLRPDPAVVKVALVGGRAVAVPASRPASSGNWVVQIGAFGSAAVARNAWGQATRRLPALAKHGPSGMNFAARTGRFYRLSVGGFARGDADALCRRYRATGGVCFVRSNAGDQVAQWLRKGGMQLASR